MQLSNLELLQLQTQFMQGDPVTQGFCKALDTPMKEIADNTLAALLWHKYDLLPEEVLDELAVMLQVLWYDVTADIDTKRNLIENSDIVYSFLGTAHGIQLVFEAWGVTVYILEWFNYAGDPYHYKLVIDYTYYEPLLTADNEYVYTSDGEQVYVLMETPYLPDGTMIAKLTDLLPLLQPARCVLDSIETTEDVVENTYADIEALGNYSDLEGTYYWDLQYQT